MSLNDVVRGLEPFFRRTLGEDIDLVTRMDPALAMTELDVNQFEQVLMNLALNARDAMPAGGRLTIETDNVYLDREYCETHADVQPGQYVMLSVSDTGMGMDDETRSRIFEPFFTTKPGGRHGSRALQRLRHREAERRKHRRVQRTGPGHQLQDIPAAGGPARVGDRAANPGCDSVVVPSDHTGSGG